jgi:tRNA A-37 threonylcarbamoyl transferase component Bud32
VTRATTARARLAVGTILRRSAFIPVAHRTWVPEDPEYPPKEDLNLAAELAYDVARSPVLRVQPILGRGIVNWAIHVEAGDVSVVVRLARAGSDETALRDYQKEAWCLEKARQIGLPGPRALSTGDHDGRAYIVLTYVPGESGVGVPMNVLGVWKELGGYAARIRQIPVSGFGNVLADSEAGRFEDSFHTSWRDQIEYNIDRLVPDDPLIRLGVYDRSQQDDVRTHFKEMLLEEWSFALSHGDLVPANTIIDGAGDVHLMDWGSAAVDVWPEGVVANTRRLLYSGKSTPAAAGWFLDGMELTDSQSARFRTRVERVMLLKAFDLTRWALDNDEPRLEDIAADAGHVWHGLRFGEYAG